MMTISRKCSQCGSDTTRKPSKRRNGEAAEHVFCDRSCYLKFRALKIEKRHCEICGIEFEVQSSSKKKICSIKCRQKHRVSKCAICSCEFSAISLRSGGGYARVERVTCSPMCFSEFMKTNEDRKKKISEAFTGENHPMWRGGVSSFPQRRGAMWGKKREEVFSIKGDRCELCGISRDESRIKYGCDLHIDHITPWHEFNNEDDANSISNLRPLCISCHGKDGAKCAHGLYTEKSGHKYNLEYMMEVYGRRCNLTLEKAKKIKESYAGDWKSKSNISQIKKETGVSFHIIRAIARGDHWINAYI